MKDNEVALILRRIEDRNRKLAVCGEYLTGVVEALDRYNRSVVEKRQRRSFYKGGEFHGSSCV